MANSILSSLLSSPSLSLVSSTTGANAATNLNVVRVAFRFRARAMRHLREDGTSLVDARIVQPTRVELDVICGKLDDVNTVNNVMMDRDSVYTVTSKGIVLGNLMAEEQTIKQTPEMISASPVRVTLKEVLTQDNQAIQQVAQPADSSMLDRGIQVIGSTVSLASSSLAATVTAFKSAATSTVSGSLIDNTGSSFVMDQSELS